MSVATSETTIVTTRRHTGRKHRAAILAILANGAAETTVEIAEALKMSRQAALLNLHALNRQGIVAEAFRRPRQRHKAGRHTIVWKIA